MNAFLGDEDDNGVGLRVIDNNRVSHGIHVGFSGNITYHEQDGYPDDPDERTTSENNHVVQAQRYAKYHVATETEHNTIPWDLNPDRFETVREALDQLSDDEITDLFGDLLLQCLSHYTDDPAVDTGDISRPVSLPTGMAGSDDAVMYRQEIYLDENNTIETTSGIIVCYYVAKGDRRTVRHGTAPDRDPDAMIEISPVPIVAADPFGDYLRYNIRCQIRDCYLGMGLEPPEKYKILGPGLYESTVKYHHYDMYPEYFDIQADIPEYRYDFTPNSPVPTEKLISAIGTGDQSKSMYERVQNILFSRST